MSASCEIKRLVEENIQLKRELHEVKRKLTSIEGQSRRENLLFDGIAETQSETWAGTEKKVHEIISKMDILPFQSIKFQRVHRTGDARFNNQERSLQCFSYFKDRDLVWQKKVELEESS